jgi:hypothetical protein
MPESHVSSGDNLGFAGIHHSERIVREIRKPNGDKITIFESGSTVIHKVGMLPRTRTPEGHVWTWVEGKAVKSIPKRKRPLDKKPLNVASNSSEAIGKQLSNFAERRFVLDGKNYHSVEGWYQGLKWPEERKRAEIAKLAGPSAKRAGKGAPKLDHIIYQGEAYKFGSAEHHRLVKAAIRASLEQNPEIAEAFRLTYPRPIEHNTGRLENPGTALPGSKFAQILEEIRRELIHVAR